MTYIDVFIVAVPRENKADYIGVAGKFAGMFKRLGALEYSEAWADDVPDGEVTSMPMAVKKKDDEDVVVGWTVWPDKATRDKAWVDAESDPVMSELGSSMPFDGKRMIFGGFEQVVKA
jgi:uncharacterized protein YbaA (DUF1428 family)